MPVNFQCVYTVYPSISYPLELHSIFDMSNSFRGYNISNGFISLKFYDKRDDFHFDIVNFPFLDGDVHTECICLSL